MNFLVNKQIYDLPPMEAHVRFKGFPSVAVALSGEILGGEGLSKTVNSTDLVSWAALVMSAS